MNQAEIDRHDVLIREVEADNPDTPTNELAKLLLDGLTTRQRRELLLRYCR